MRNFDEDLNDQPTYATPPPDVIGSLVSIIDRKKSMPLCFPPTPVGAAVWWTKLQKPMEKFERPRTKPKKNGKGIDWITPYIERVTYNLQKFLKMSPEAQEFIVAATEDGVYWHGHDYDHHKNLYEEVMKMHDVGVIPYRNAIAARVKIILKSGMKLEQPEKKNFEITRQEQLNALQQKIDQQAEA